jgi:hypothetical protein
MRVIGMPDPLTGALIIDGTNATQDGNAGPKRRALITLPRQQ